MPQLEALSAGTAARTMESRRRLIRVKPFRIGKRVIGKRVASQSPASLPGKARVMMVLWAKFFCSGKISA